VLFRSERVFEPFFTTKGKDKGTGLGLSMVYGFVKQSNGHIKIESEVSRGTTVVMHFPRSSVPFEAEAGAERSVGTEERAGADALVLVVEDEEGMRNVAVRLLTELGYRTLEAENGPIALALLEEHREIDLLFSDVIMPGGMNGYELAREARRRRPDLRILLTSGFAAEAQAEGPARAAADAAAFDLLDKPFRKRELARRIRQVLGEDSTGADVPHHSPATQS
jgi:CheY-like chemotaxis protein